MLDTEVYTLGYGGRRGRSVFVTGSVVVRPFLISEEKEDLSKVLVTKRLELASRLPDRAIRMSKHIAIRGLKETVCIGKDPREGGL